jgi:hypothetical protein
MTEELLPIVAAEIGNGIACDRPDKETARRVLAHVETWLAAQTTTPTSHD